MKSVFTGENKWKVSFPYIPVSFRLLLLRVTENVICLDEFTEELLEEHEKELEEINMYYMHNEQLFVNLANWHEVWAEYREFQVSFDSDCYDDWWDI